MILYHGSTVIVETPEIRKGVNYLDFGSGFYTTTCFEQAARWARTKARRESLDRGFVSVYEFDLESAKNNLQIHTFEQADREWLVFVTENRSGDAKENRFDLTIGPVADDNVYQSILLFESGVLNVEDTLIRLKTEVLHDQWAFHSQEAVASLHFLESREILREGD